MSSSRFIVASVLHSFRETLRSQCKKGYYGAWNENQMDVSNSSNYNCEVAAPSANVLKHHSKHTKADDRPFQCYYNAAINYVIAIKIRALARTGCLDRIFIIKSDV